MIPRVRGKARPALKLSVAGARSPSLRMLPARNCPPALRACQKPSNCFEPIPVSSQKRKGRETSRVATSTRGKIMERKN